MPNEINTAKTDEETWDELLSSTDGALALEHLLAGVDLDIQLGDIIEDID